MKLGVLISFENFLANLGLDLSECFRILSGKSIGIIMKSKNPYALCNLYKNFYEQYNGNEDFMNYFIENIANRNDYLNPNIQKALFEVEEFDEDSLAATINVARKAASYESMINALNLMYKYGVYTDYMSLVFSLIAEEKDTVKGNLLWNIVEKNAHDKDFTIAEVTSLFYEMKKLDNVKNNCLKELFTSSNIKLNYQQKKKVMDSIINADTNVTKNVANSCFNMDSVMDLEYVLILLKCKNTDILNITRESTSKPCTSFKDIKVVANAIGARQALNASDIFVKLNSSDAIKRDSDFYKIPKVVANQVDIRRSDAMKKVYYAFEGYIGTYNIIKYMNKCKNADFVYAIGDLATTLRAHKIVRLIELYKKRPTNIKLENIYAVELFSSVLKEEDMLNILSSNYDYVLFSTLYDKGNRVEAVNGLHLLDEFFKKRFIDLDIEVNPEKCYVPYIKRD